MSALADDCKGRWPSILMQLGLPLSEKLLNHKNVPCPMCGGTDRFQFTDKDVGLWHCRGCGEGGDGVRLVMRMKRIGFKEAAQLIEGVVGGSARAPQNGGSGNGAVKPCDPLKPWRGASDILGTVGDVYLRNRGLALTAFEARPLRFRRQYHWKSGTVWPCIVALVRLADGTELCGHQTFLEEDGSAKARLLGEAARLFPSGSKVMGGGVWFGASNPKLQFLVGEGIESTLSAMRLYGAVGGCAALSAPGPTGLVLPAEARLVRIFADNDPDGKGLAAAVSARLRWRSEGREVRISHSPTVGVDANDVLMRRLGRHAETAS
jgi:putative DNA primase/helicase